VGKGRGNTTVLLRGGGTAPVLGRGGGTKVSERCFCTGGAGIGTGLAGRTSLLESAGAVEPARAFLGSCEGRGGGLDSTERRGGTICECTPRLGAAILWYFPLNSTEPRGFSVTVARADIGSSPTTMGSGSSSGAGSGSFWILGGAGDCALGDGERALDDDDDGEGAETEERESLRRLRSSFMASKSSFDFFFQSSTSASSRATVSCCGDVEGPGSALRRSRCCTVATNSLYCTLSACLFSSAPPSSCSSSEMRMLCVWFTAALAAHVAHGRAGLGVGVATDFMSFFSISFKRISYTALTLRSRRSALFRLAWSSLTCAVRDFTCSSSPDIVLV
jgi:hypothetical protein